MRKITCRMIFLASCAASAVAIATPATAQVAVDNKPAANGDPQSAIPPQTTDSNDGLRDIVVTARRRTESVQSTPLSVSAFDARSLTERNVQNISDVTRMVPNVQLDAVASESGAASTQIAIRGIGATDYVLTVEPAVGVYLDGVYVGKSLGSLLDTADVDRVEVLRGPQGTLFGKNTIGGAISVYTKRPTAEPEYDFSLTTGQFNRLDAKAALSGPITPWLRYRASVSFQSRNGFVQRYVKTLTSGIQPIDEYQGNINRLGGRLVLEADLAPDLLATLSLDGNRIREQSPASFLVRVSETAGFPGAFNKAVPGGVCQVAAGASRFSNPYCFNSQYTLPIDSRITYNSGGNRSDTDVKGASLTLAWTPGDVAFKSITAFREVNVDLKQDLGGMAYYNSQVGQQIDFKQFSQELQLSGAVLDKKLSYVLGAYYLNESGRQQFPVYASFAQFLSGGDIKNDSYALFGQLNWEITKGLSLTAGYRYSIEQRRFNPGLQKILGYDDLSTIKIPGLVNPFVNAFGVPGSPLFPAGWYERTSKGGTPMVSLSYKIVPDVMIYGTFSEGFKGGGFTMRFFPAVRPAAGVDPDTLIPYAQPERAKSYEIGFKSELFDRKLRFNVAGYLTDYNNIQVTYVVDPDGPGPIGKIVPVLANAGTARIKGIEVEAAAVPAKWIRFDGSLGYTDAKYTSFTAASLVAYPNALSLRIPNAPRWTYNIGSTLTFFDTSDGKLSLRADWSHRSSQYKEFANDLNLFQPAYGVLDTSLTFRSGDEKWSVTAGVTNLTDKAYIVSGFASSDRAQIVRSRPREWFLTLQHKM